jgi:signal transduction histidine kinase
VSGPPTGPYLIRGIVKSYYFWAILTMMAILGFGVSMLGRLIAQERKVLKLKSEFVSSVSHEFKTPITSIMALTERLLSGNMKDQNRMREYFNTIARDAENLKHLVGNILDFSKIEEGKKVYHFEETDIKGWLKEVLEHFFRYQEQRIYSLQTTMSDSGVPVHMDRSAMQLAINNLLDNAVKFSASHTDITLSLEKQTMHYLLKIKDEGIGIPAQEQSRIFEKFYRGKYTANNFVTGTGLGLAIVKQVIEGHGGEITLDSSPGKGSVFIIRFPIKNIPQ